MTPIAEDTLAAFSGTAYIIEFAEAYADRSIRDAVTQLQCLLSDCGWKLFALDPGGFHGGNPGAVITTKGGTPHDERSTCAGGILSEYLRSHGWASQYMSAASASAWDDSETRLGYLPHGTVKIQIGENPRPHWW